MRRWGILITVIYFLILAFLIDPSALYILGPDVDENFGSLPFWMQPAKYDEAGTGMFIFLAWAVLLVIAQAALLFLAVDSSDRRLRPRRHVAVSIAATGGAVGLLVFFAIMSAGVGVDGDAFLDNEPAGWAALALMLCAWVAWAVVFYAYKRGASERLTTMTRWLIGGSILELLIAVPCHIMVRGRNECSAPGVTAYGIATGIAVMLLAFGPAVLFLYRKRLDEYQRKRERAES